MNIENNNKQFLMSINDAADVFGIGRQKLRQLIKVEPTIPVIKIGTMTKIIVPEFEKWLIQVALEGREL